MTIKRGVCTHYECTKIKGLSGMHMRAHPKVFFEWSYLRVLFTAPTIKRQISCLGYKEMISEMISWELWIVICLLAWADCCLGTWSLKVRHSLIVTNSEHLYSLADISERLSAIDVETIP